VLCRSAVRRGDQRADSRAYRGTRLLISYGVALGFLSVHDHISVDGMPPSVESLRRVSEGLRDLT